RSALVAEYVNRPVFCGGHQPGGRIVRQAPQLPDLERPAEGVLHDVLRQRQVMNAEHASEGGDHPSRLAPEKMVHGHRARSVAPARIHRYIFMTGRISTKPPRSRIGQPLESSAASARSRASMRL